MTGQFFGESSPSAAEFDRVFEFLRDEGLVGERRYPRHGAEEGWLRRRYVDLAELDNRQRQEASP